MYGSSTASGSTNSQTLQPQNRLEDRIRTLSEKLVQADGDEFQRLAVELRAAITEHIECIRARLAQYPLAEERRSPK